MLGVLSAIFEYLNIYHLYRHVETWASMDMLITSIEFMRLLKGVGVKLSTRDSDH